MIDTIDISTAAVIPYNYYLIKSDPAYDFHEIATSDGTVTLQLSYFMQDKAKHVSISGTVIMVPRETFFYDNKPSDHSGIDFESMVRNSLEFDANCDVKVGDRIFFDYREQIDVEQERRVVKTKEHGLCILVRQDRIYGKYGNGELIPVNGYVFFKRDRMPAHMEVRGLEIIQTINKYESNWATVIAVDVPCKAHLEGDHEPQTELIPGDRIIIQKGRGFCISYDLGNDELRDVEIVHRKDIAGITKSHSEYPDLSKIEFKEITEEAYGI
jgi:co-chaperonin GroES (HSP10)